MRYGQTIIDSVEIHNCSQTDTFKSALRFEGVSELWSSVSNSALHNGNAWGVYIKSAANILFKANVIFSFKPIGLGVLTSKNITIDGNVVGYVDKRFSFTGLRNLDDKEGSFSICAYFKGDKCSGISVINNIASGSPYSGFVVGVGYNCGEE